MERFLWCAVLPFVALASMLVATTVAAQSRPTSRDQCLITFSPPSYVAWVCNGEGTEWSDPVLLVQTRQAPSGRATVRVVWEGPRATLNGAAPQLIAQDQTQHARCRTYFHIAGVSGGEVHWNRVTKNMRAWWDRDGQRRFKEFCYATIVQDADYVLAWAESTSQIPFSFSLPLPKTTTTYGTFRSSGAGQTTYRSTSTTTEMLTFSDVVTVSHVTLAILPVIERGGLAALAEPVTWIEKHRGKPDKDALREALDNLRKGIRVGLQ